MKLIPERENIPRLYEVEKLSTVDIGKRVGLTPGAVGSILRRRGVKLRNPKEALAVKYPDGKFGANHPRWKGGVQKHGEYVVIYNTDHPRAQKSRRVFEHILVAEKKIGRYIEKNEIVHHINGIKSDNRPENLEVCKRNQHYGYHITSGKGIQALLLHINYLEGLLNDHKIKFTKR